DIPPPYGGIPGWDVFFGPGVSSDLKYPRLHPDAAALQAAGHLFRFLFPRRLHSLECKTLRVTPVCCDTPHSDGARPRLWKHIRRKIVPNRTDTRPNWKAASLSESSAPIANPLLAR